MSISTNPGFQAVAGADAYGELALVELQAKSGTLRLTNWPLNVQVMGQTWIGLGALGTIGELHESDDGASEKVSMKLSVADESLRAFSLSDPSDYQDRPARIWIALLDASTLQIQGAPVLRFAGVMDQMTIEREGSTGSIGVNCRTVSYDVRSNPSALRMNHAQHIARHPGELGFVHLQSMIGQPQLWVGVWLQAWLKFRAYLKG